MLISKLGCCLFYVRATGASAFALTLMVRRRPPELQRPIAGRPRHVEKSGIRILLVDSFSRELWLACSLGVVRHVRAPVRMCALSATVPQKRGVAREVADEGRGPVPIRQRSDPEPHQLLQCAGDNPDFPPLRKVCSAQRQPEPAQWSDMCAPIPAGAGGPPTARSFWERTKLPKILVLVRVRVPGTSTSTILWLHVAGRHI